MSITKHMKGVQDIKKLHAELTTAQTQKQECHAQMEPLQEWVAEVLAQAEEAKTHIAQTQEECMELVSDKNAAQIVDTLKEKTAQAHTQATELKENSRQSPRRSRKHTRIRWLGISHMSVLRAFWR